MGRLALASLESTPGSIIDLGSTATLEAVSTIAVLGFKVILISAYLGPPLSLMMATKPRRDRNLIAVTLVSEVSKVPDNHMPEWSLRMMNPSIPTCCHCLTCMRA